MEGFDVIRLFTCVVALSACAPVPAPVAEPPQEHVSPASDHMGRVGAARPSTAGVYPDGRLTPGAVDPACTVKDVCEPGYTAKVRHVTEKTRREVFAAYGITKDFGEYEADHFLSLELCGSNDPENLWPEPYAGVSLTARDKDKVENFLRREICADPPRMSLKEAQDAIRHDWVAVYRKCCEK